MRRPLLHGLTALIAALGPTLWSPFVLAAKSGEAAEFAVRWEPAAGGPADIAAVRALLGLTAGKLRDWQVRYVDVAASANSPPTHPVILRERVGGGTTEWTWKLRGAQPLTTWRCPFASPRSRKDEIDMSFGGIGEPDRAWSHSCTTTDVAAATALAAVPVQECRASMRREEMRGPGGTYDVEAWTLADGRRLIEISAARRDTPTAIDQFQRQVVNRLVAAGAKLQREGMSSATCAAQRPTRSDAITVGTWNLAWLMSEATHAHWTATCARLHWPRSSDALAPADRELLAGLPYCNVHNGMRFPPDRCRSTQDGWPDALRYPAMHPCRDTADLASATAYAQKLAALRRMWLRLDAMGVQLLALQEVVDAAAVQAILPPGWSVTTTHEAPGAPAIAQQVGVAWRNDLRLRATEGVLALADGGIPTRPLRPGLAFTVDVGGKPVRALVLHLKAGCRSREIDAPLGKADTKLSAERQAAIASDCAMLRYQLPALEAWIDAHAAQDFAVLGDFNRTLLREPAFDSTARPTRLDGSSARDPLGPCTLRREGQRLVADCPARTRALFPEINDRDPPGAELWRARFVDGDPEPGSKRGTAGDCRLMGPGGDLMHDGIDHILISASLKLRLQSDALTLRVINYVDAAGAPLQASADLAQPSDHCPHLVTWTPR